MAKKTIAHFEPYSKDSKTPLVAPNGLVYAQNEIEDWGTTSISCLP
jgi:hypothetical protein